MKRHLKPLAGAAALALCAGSVSAQDLTVTSFGGAYGAAQKEHMIDPFVAETGTNILFEDYGGGVAEMKAQVEAGNIQWDVVDVEVIDLERACAEGYLEVIDQSVLPVRSRLRNKGYSGTHGIRRARGPHLPPAGLRPARRQACRTRRAW